MTMTQLRETAAEVKDRAIDVMSGEATLTRLDFGLIGAICFLAGVCIGLIAAPLTHGVSIFSHNVNNGSSKFAKNGNNHGNQYNDREEDGNM